ncbi:biotin-dependent carboxyltransferase family protein [Halopseudomonas yangmingensis]|uniref:Allophanate hydrolase n=1 Tax=Halopseudomonas yangmingensis TaxID=1720063 RepID=A0A1I4S134_9GAMM|nr:biotin-dependent carboxyltransferase family protein [Halopseudomonas yangmingensis]SFM58228.1 allophanate hydrolase [Halopseudomonas yangmingensis]
MSLYVEATLGLAQLQDQGRFGVRHLGIGQGGALDWQAALLANRLLGNSTDCCVLEIPAGGLTLGIEADTSLALSGADLQARLDDKPIAPWHSLQARAGQRLRLQTPRHGLRAYLAVPGGFQTPVQFGARATLSREGLGGLHGDGRALQVGDRLPFVAATRPPAAVIETLRPDYSAAPLLALIPGGQLAYFSGTSVFALFNSDWLVDPASDRMGIRLRGPQLVYHGAPLISEGIALGAVQVPPDGQPVVLLNDRQTIGGYPKLGALTPLALARLAQLQPGQALRLRATTVEQARHDLLAWFRRAEGGICYG